MVDDFLAYFYSVYDQYKSKNYLRMSATEIYSDYKILVKKLLHEWKAPIINDFLCMVHFGLFKKLTASWCEELGDMIQNDLLCGEGNMESAEPTRELIRMANLIIEDEKLKKLIVDTKARDCHEALRQSDHKEFLKRVEKYIDAYGHRCMSEMKLEQKDLHQDPTFLFVCLKNYLNSDLKSLHEYEKREREIREAAEEKVFKHLSGFKSYIYEWSMHHARKAVRNRENLRFCRTRIYGVVRRMFYGMGNEFTLRGMIDKPEDVFYLTLVELKGTLDGILPGQDLRGIIEARRKEYERYADIEPDSRFFTKGVCYWSNDHLPKEEEVDTSDLPENCIKGLGCCPGVVEGVVKIVMTPEDDMELNGEILVTMRTDPGWIPLYPSLSGLLVERGGLLSHSAIVAREMGLPTVVSIKGLTKTLKSGMRIKLDGQTGIVEILDGDGSTETGSEEGAPPDGGEAADGATDKDIAADAAGEDDKEEK